MRSLLAGVTLAAALALPAAAFDITAMSDAERAAFRDEVRAYLLENPQVLLEAISALEEREFAAQMEGDGAIIAENQDEIFADGHSWVGGNPDGDVTLVEFADYSCGFCRQAHPELVELLAFDGNIRFVVKEFPILGPGSDLAARFAIAVLQTHDDAAYESVHDRLMTHRGGFDQPSLERLAAEMGLDMAAINARMQSPEVSAVIAANQDLARRLQINGTPTFVLGDRMIRGYLPLANMLDVIDEVRTAEGG